MRGALERTTTLTFPFFSVVSTNDGTNLIAGKPYNALLPDYQPDATYPYL